MTLTRFATLALLGTSTLVSCGTSSGGTGTGGSGTGGKATTTSTAAMGGSGAGVMP